MDWNKRLHEAVVKGQKNEMPTLVSDAVASGISPANLANEAIIPAMNTVSDLWRNGDYFIPEVIRSAATMQAGMDTLKPYLVSGEHGKGVRVAIGTVKGDMHDIGKNLVALMLEGVGYEIENLGVDIPPERFIEAAQNGARVIGMSCLLTTSMPEMKNVVELFRARGERDKVTIIVGGAPITMDSAMKMGADYYAENAAEAVEILNNHFD